jgi:hypothetical protein
MGFTLCAPVAQGIERLPPEQKAAGSNPAGGTTLTSANADFRTGLAIPYPIAHLRTGADPLAENRTQIVGFG